MNYPCDQIDCLIHPIYIEKERARLERAKQEKNIELTQSNHIYTLSSITNNINPQSYIKIPCLEENICFECILCQNFKRLDMQSNLIIYNAKKVLRN